MSNALMVAAARMYHLEDLSKVEIAKKLSTNRRHVAELLTSARQEGLIRFDIFQTAAQELEKQLGERYPHMKKVIVRPGSRITSPEQYPGLVKQLAIGASEFFETLPGSFPRKNTLNISVSGGRHVLAFANCIANQDRHNIRIQIPALIGRGSNQSSTHINPVVNASILWARCGYLPGHCNYATVPPYPPAAPGPKTRRAVREQLEALGRNQAISQVVRAMDDIDVVFTGIGSVHPKVTGSLRKFFSFSLLEFVATPQQLESEGAAGSIGYCYYDKFGQGNEDWRFWLTAGHFSEHYWGVQFYKHMVESGKFVVAFSNPFDVQPVITALREKMFNVLIIDEYSAKKILEEA
ncbi:sugar-binding domain-containing protein [Acidicapsa ligni]|uniref:sugar-binding domain-containing protein n=1 Tax=Acidicapsa ligni TaxID=542300 RepID=UPI0021E0321D|nr:sugar-binding domain-containing protein [Acidicapsa ligni]